MLVILLLIQLTIAAGQNQHMAVVDGPDQSNIDPQGVEPILISPCVGFDCLFETEAKKYGAGLSSKDKSEQRDIIKIRPRRWGGCGYKGLGC